MNYQLARQLFEKCAYRSDYETIGNDVNYKFDVEGSHLYIYFQGSKDIKADKGWIDWLRNFWFFPRCTFVFTELYYCIMYHEVLLC